MLKLNTKAWWIVIYVYNLSSVEILQNLLLTCEQGQTPPPGEGMDLVPLPMRPDAFRGFESDTYMLPGSKRNFLCFMTIM